MDIQFIEITDTIPLSSVDYLAHLEVPTLKIVATDTSSAKEVLINSTPSPSIVIVSGTEIWAQIPDLDGPIRDIELISERVTSTEKSRLTIGFGGRLNAVSGLEKLMQRFIKVLMTTAGSDMRSPGIGGGLNSFQGSPVGQSERDASSAVVLAVDKTRQDIFALQAEQDIDPSERLQSAQIESTVWNPNTLTLDVRLALLNDLGEVASTRIGVSNE